MTGVLIRDTQGETQGRRGESHVKMEAEIRVMLPQAKECLEPPEARRGGEALSLTAFVDPLISDLFPSTLWEATLCCSKPLG